MKKSYFNYGVRITIIYWLVSFIWIFFSDKLLQNLINDFDQITHIQTIKGIVFITLTALLIYFLIQFYQKKQKSIENRIIENEERQRLLIENSMDAIMVSSPDGRIIDVNPSAERIFGKTAQEIIEGGRDGIMDLYDPRLTDALKVRQETGSFVGELNFVRNDGSIFPGDVSTQLFTDSEGNLRTSMIIRDVSERKKLENSLKASEERLRLAVNSAKQGIYDLNIETGDVVVNEIYAQMLGYNPENFQETAQSWMSRIHLDDYEFVSQYFNDYISGKIEKYELEFRLERADGSYIWILSLGSIVQRDESGNPLRMLGTHTDITERKKAEREKNLFSNILEESLNEIYVFDDNTFQFIQVNKAAISNLGYSMEELLNMTPIDIKTEVSLEQFNNIIAPLRDGEEKQIVFETIHQRKDKTTYEVEVHLQLQTFVHESLFTAIIMDISDRKQQEKLIKEERQRLASIIEGTNIATWEWKVQTGETVFDERWAEMLGYSLSELKPFSIETWKKLTHPEDLVKAMEMLEKHFSGEIDYYDIEFRMKHKDGRWIWVQDRGRVSEWTQEGKPLLMLGTHYDITKRKENETKFLNQLDELRRWHAITLGREERIIELKREINKLLIKNGKPPRYESVT